MPILETTPVLDDVKILLEEMKGGLRNDSEGHSTQNREKATATRRILREMQNKDE